MFGFSTGFKTYSLPQGGRLEVHRDYLGSKATKALFKHLMESVLWAQSDLKMAGRIVKTPRLQCWMGDEGVSPDVYAKTRMGWTEPIEELRQKLSAFCPEKREINYVLLNLYQDGNHSISYHADNEVVEDDDLILSISLGHTRRFLVKPRDKTEKTLAIDLCDGDLVIMDGHMQRSYLHSVPKTAREVGPRINLTFRRAKSE